MPRRSRSTGVGRGNGLGSVKTQFRDGMPSANPHGRPKKPKKAPPGSILEALALELAKPIPVTVDGKRQMMPQHHVLAINMLAQLPKSSMAQQVAALKMFISVVPKIASPEGSSNFDQTLDDVFAILAEEAAADQERERQLVARLGRLN